MPADRPKPKRPEDNLRPEGDFERPHKPEYQPGERPVAKKPQDNLKPEGEFVKRTVEEYRAIRADRADIVRHEDNITVGGEFTGKPLFLYPLPPLSDSKLTNSTL